jgi:hypothetical protein
MESIRKLVVTSRLVSVKRNFGVKAMKTLSVGEIPVRNIRGITTRVIKIITITIIIED